MAGVFYTVEIFHIPLEIMQCRETNLKGNDSEYLKCHETPLWFSTGRSQTTRHCVSRFVKKPVGVHEKLPLSRKILRKEFPLAISLEKGISPSDYSIAPFTQ